MQPKGQHVLRRGRVSMWWAAVAAVVLLGGAAAGVLLTRGGSSSTTTAASGRSKESTTTTVPLSVLSARLAATVSFQPSSGAAAVPPNAPVVVTAPTGRLTSVSLTSPMGAIAGVLDPTAQKWVSAPALEAGEPYTVTATIQNANGLTGTARSTFTTDSPTHRVKDILLPDTGTVNGVGSPVVVKFPYSIYSAAARASVLSHFTITESSPVAGGWHWFSPTELHFRPEYFWPVGERVTVSSNLRGWNAGDGMWGTGLNSVTFAIGDSHVSTANLATHVMTVTDNGKLLWTFPISGGRDQYPTMDGIHIALDKEPVVHMVSSTVGIPVNSPNGYNEFVYDDVHISDSGEYVHSAPWSVGSQGITNVSHGCINISPGNAAKFMNFSQVGDVISVVGGPRPPAYGDHGVMDWTTPWNQWTPGVVHHVAPPPPPTTTPTTATTVPPTTVAPTNVAVKPSY
ncbi:MAG: L,D-transpeptidase family protein [Acidimicrobiaceae bacterium]|nr:L,D-transpeptidase family protein [Acidimicrobiaceae bacterium]